MSSAESSWAFSKSSSVSTVHAELGLNNVPVVVTVVLVVADWVDSVDWFDAVFL